jgi:hypothetical protein
MVRQRFGNDGHWEADCKGVLASDGEGPKRGHFPEPAKLYHICPKEEEAEARAAFEEAGISVNFCHGKR